MTALTILLACVHALAQEEFGRTAESALLLRERLRLMTPTPKVVSVVLWELCVPVTTVPKSERARVGPHANLAVNYYVSNNAVEHFATARRTFPLGAIVLKEKLAADGELVAVAGMVKRAAGYDSRAGDWEYFYAERGGTLSRGAIEPCVSCHARAKATDYVFTTIGSKG